MTNQQPGSQQHRPHDGPHACDNCFAEFAWRPTLLNGEEYCCAGCAEGGPCICTYTEPPESEEDAAGVAVGAVLTGEEGQGGPAGPEPTDQPPEIVPPDGPGAESGASARRAVILGAVAEMPASVQEAVRLRIEEGASDEAIAERLGTTQDEARRLLDQGQAMLNRELGPGFRIEYLPRGEGEEPRFEQPAPEEREPEEGAPEFGQFELPGERERPGAGLADLIVRAVEDLTRSATADSEAEDPDRARRLVTEALRDAGDLFRLAAERISAPEGEYLPLRQALADMVEDQITVIVLHPPDPAGFVLARDRLEVVTWARVESMDDERAVFRVQVASFMGLIRSLLALEAPNRPSRLQLSGTVVTVYLAPPGEQGVAPTGAPPARTGAGGERGPRFELAVDAFFGARHFIFSNDRQGPPHHHSYRVEAVLQSATQDRDGFVIGFAQAREMIESTVMEFNETLLNTIDPFLETQPTTENLARVIHDRIAERMAASPARLRQVRVWESPTNSAIYSDAAVTS